MSNPNKSYFDKYTDPVVREIDKVNIYEFENGMDYELTISGKPINVDTIKEAQNKVLKNLKKDPTFYTNMLVNETIKMVGEYGSGKKPGVRSTAKSAESVKKDGKMPKASKQDAPFGGKDEVKGKYKSSGMEPAKKVPGSLNESKQIKESFQSLEKKLEKGGKSHKAAAKIAGKVANLKRMGHGSGPTAKQKARFDESYGNEIDVFTLNPLVLLHAIDNNKELIEKVKKAVKDDVALKTFINNKIKEEIKKGRLNNKEKERRTKVIHGMYRMVTGYVNGQLLIASIAGIFAFVAMVIASSIFNVTINAVALAFIVTLIGLIPMIGNILASVVVIVVCLFVSLPLAITMGVYFLIYQQVENATLQPYIQSKYNELTPLIVFIAALVGIQIAGFLGALIAIPAAGCIRIYLKEYHGDKLASRSSK